MTKELDSTPALSTVGDKAEITPTWFVSAFRQHPALLISSVYLFASLIGLVYSWALLQDFGINVFRYSDVSDFLLASLKEPLTWLLTLIVVASYVMDYFMSLRSERKGAGGRFSWYTKWYGTPRYRALNFLTIPPAVALCLYIFAEHQADKIRSGDGDIVSVYLTDETPPRQLTLLSTTARFAIFFDHENEQIDIHPNENILRIRKTAVPEEPPVSAHSPSAKTDRGMRDKPVAP